ncbi:hypothetical protein [Staphylococcus gallinarum]|uniref:hypothetical protein n=1 Tax=Staphylococcus gallinarum TaxID=1293 RepID=UPI0030BF0832
MNKVLARIVKIGFIITLSISVLSACSGAVLKDLRGTWSGYDGAQTVSFTKHKIKTEFIDGSGDESDYKVEKVKGRTVYLKEDIGKGRWNTNPYTISEDGNSLYYHTDKAKGDMVFSKIEDFD